MRTTAELTDDGSGLAVGVLQTGRVYSDDLRPEGLTYHYPSTDRGKRDLNEIAAMKACGDHGLPIFVVIKPHRHATTRTVELGWVQDYDDEAGALLISFIDTDSPQRVRSEPVEEMPFSLQVARPTKRTNAKVRPNQWRFRFDVFKRYGAQCAVCDIRHDDLLHAAHVCAVEDHGCDDARNGLVFCLTHHRAFDRALFKIDPETLQVVPAAYTGRMSEIGITRDSLSHLPRVPHPEALRWAWERAHTDC